MTRATSSPPVDRTLDGHAAAPLAHASAAPESTLALVAPGPRPIAT
jgi:hypothetical protein